MDYTPQLQEKWALLRPAQQAQLMAYLNTLLQTTACTKSSETALRATFGVIEAPVLSPFSRSDFYGEDER